MSTRAGEPAEASVRPRRRPGRWVVVLAVVAILLAGALVFFLVRLTGERHDQDDRLSVREAAQSQVLNVVSLSTQGIEKRIADVKASSTGPFLEEFKGNEQNLLAVLGKDKVVANATIAGGDSGIAVETIKNGVAKVLVATDVTRSNNASQGQPVTTPFRIELEMSKVKDRWLTSQFTFVINEAQGDGSGKPGQIPDPAATATPAPAASPDPAATPTPTPTPTPTAATPTPAPSQTAPAPS